MSTSVGNNQFSSLSLQSLPQAAAKEKQQSYGQILRSSALIGGSSVLNIAIRIIRTKAMAVLLGPALVLLFTLKGRGTLRAGAPAALTSPSALTSPPPL